MSDISYAVLSRAKAKYGKRLKEKDYKALIECENVSEVMTYLKTNTHYFYAFGEANERDIHRETFENLLRQYLNYEFDNICRFELSVGEYFSKFMGYKTETDEIIKLLTLLNSNDDKHFNFTFPAHLEKTTQLTLNSLSGITTYQDFLKAIKSTRYEKIFNKYNFDKTEKFPIAEIENELTIQNYKELYKTLDKLSDVEQSELRDLYDTIIDFENITRIIRLKNFYNFDFNSVKKQLLPFGTFNESKIEKLYKTSNNAEFYSLISKGQYGKLIDKDDLNSPSQINKKVKFKKANHNMYFSGSPATVMMSYIILAELEIINLICIVEGVRYNINKDKIKSLLIY